MKIAIDARMYGPAFTGIGRYLSALIDELAVIDRENRYLVILNREQYERFDPPGPHIEKRCCEIPIYSWQEQLKMPRYLEQLGADLVHFPHFNVPIFYRKPFVVTIHDLTLSRYPERGFSHWIKNIAYRYVMKNSAMRSRRIVAVSEHTKRDIVRSLKVPPEKISVIYNGADGLTASSLTLETLSASYGVRSPYFLYTGMWRYHKNLEGLLSGFSRFRQGNGSFQLVITGTGGRREAAVKERVSELGLADAVCFTGMVPDTDLSSLYAHADAFVFPSLYEGFGLPPLEAMSLGIPVLASDRASIPEICGPDNALYFDPEDPDAIAGAMNRIADDDTLAAALRKRGVKRAGEFNWKVSAAALKSLYMEIV